MGDEPLGLFSALMRVCIMDESDVPRKVLAPTVLSFALGVAASIATFYALAVLNLLP